MNNFGSEFPNVVPPAQPHDPWVVEIKGSHNSGSYEISVLRDSNTHGKRSYGWYGPDKIHISDSGGPCSHKVLPQVWDRLVRCAHDVAADLNAIDVSATEIQPSRCLSMG